MSPEQKDAQREKNKLWMKRSREEESADQKEQNKLKRKRSREEESADQKDAQKEIDKSRKKKHRDEENTESTAARKIKDTTSKKRKRQCRLQTNTNNVYNDKEIKDSNERLMKKAKHFLHRTKDPDHPNRFRAFVCIICDCFIIGTEKIHKLKPEQIRQHSHRLSVK